MRLLLRSVERKLQHPRRFGPGLAKVTAGKRVAEGVGASAMATAATAEELLTSPGVAMGTLAYMSPEQARGEELDVRTDLFSLGVVLYEMATGQPAFSGNTSALIFDAILHKTPTSPLRLNPDLPVELERIISKSLEKDRDVRYQVASELRADLKRLKRDTDSGRSGATAAVGTPRLQKRRWRWATVAGVAVMVAAVGIYQLTRPLPSPRVLQYTEITQDGREKLFFIPGMVRIPLPFVTDGPRLIFHESYEGRPALAQIAVSGGEAVSLPTPFTSPALLDISPNRAEVLIADSQAIYQERPLMVLPILGGSARRLGDVAAHDGTWSPDGQSITYLSGSDLYLAKSDGTDPHKLASIAGMPWWPRWSPEGDRLRFTVWDAKANSYSLWEISADGRNLHPLLPGWNNPPAECCGNWTPDGRYFLFQATRHGATHVWALRERGRFLTRERREPLQLTSGQRSSFAPVSSADGRQLFIIGEQRRGELVRYDAGSHQFVAYLSGISAEHLDFSRDGEWVTYVTYPEGTLWRSRRDGSEKLQLTFPPIRSFLPRWAPDRKQIAFVSAAPGRPPKIHLISAEGGTPVQAMPGDRDEFHPDWSPDGKTLLFGRHLWFEPESAGTAAIHILDLRTHQVSTLPGSDSLFSPRWSPDGRYIAALSLDGQKIMLFDFTQRKWLTFPQNGADFLNWSHDGKSIYFHNVFGKETGIFRIQVGNRKSERVVGPQELGRTNGALNPWLGLDPIDSFLVLRDIGTQEIYALDWEAP